MRKLTKKEVIKMFRAEVMPTIIELYGRGDKVAQREEWNNFTDMLCKDRQISQHQYNTWTNPF